MNFPSWIALLGSLLLIMALLVAYLRRMPFTSSSIYLALGLAVGPGGLGLVAIDFIRERIVIEHLTTVAVIISLFVVGLKLRLPLSDPAWSAAFRLAGPVMVASIAGVAVFTHVFLGIGWPESLLLGSILAPTDPVLAGMVSVNHAADHDRTRYGLSGEAGFNDGAAFPFVAFSLLWLQHDEVGSWIGSWALHRLVWAVPAGLLIGYGLGKLLGHLAIRLRSKNPDSGSPGDFLALALIALSYAGAEAVGAWGFLAVFAAGLGVRRSEVHTAESHPAPEHVAAIDRSAEDDLPHPPAEDFADNLASVDASNHPTKAAGQMVAEIISFGDTAERLLEVMLVLLMGICLSTYWDPRAVPVAFALFVVIRPLATFLGLIGTPTRPSQRGLMGWFGIRGIGSLYYLAYALNHGLASDPAGLVGLTLSVVALSIAIHGATSPLLDVYQRTASRRRAS
jgi:NhaP-type Na+/H+ or K+/H+ antiporter